MFIVHGSTHVIKQFSPHWKQIDLDATRKKSFGVLTRDMKVLLAFLLAILCWGCGPAEDAERAALPVGCVLSGKVIRGELPQPRRGYPYEYRLYLPPCYSVEESARYPVLYLVPGRNGSPDSWFAAHLAKRLDELILNRDIQPFLLVTTENIGADPRAEIIHEELIPFIESQYPILNDRRYRAVAGGSLGGIAAYRLAFRHPGDFSSAGIFGAGAISGEEAQIKEWLTQMGPAHRTRVFLDCGNEDIFMLDRARVMKSILEETGIEHELHIGQGGHTYAYWISNFELYLKWLTKDW